MVWCGNWPGRFWITMNQMVEATPLRSLLAPKQIPCVFADVLSQASGVGSRISLRSLVLGHTWVINQPRVPHKGTPLVAGKLRSLAINRKFQKLNCIENNQCYYVPA